ncbi:UDP-galactose transporter 2-like isoform X1 [Canna indica]|uniref:UDP-galactose transporter 2-like isoform X1 n=1 Tax=Canna indica TaxID=4628 RepID=A0AAQ3QLW5_9LILI|nr:UDP-galactose transporter 2-like isoform X1 [Canna indica]
MEEAKTSPAVSNVGAWAMNVVSSVGIIIANKQLMSNSGFAFSFGLSLSLSLNINVLISSDNSDRLPLRRDGTSGLRLKRYRLLCIKGCPALGAPLILKLSMIPVVCVMEWILHSKHYSKEVKMAVIVVVVGVGFCTVTDVKVNAKGFFCACAAVLSSSFQQISIDSLLKKYSIGSFELLSKTAPIQALSLILLGPIIDFYLNGKSILKCEFSTAAIAFILLSRVLAVFCNINQYLCIGRFSAVSFQVIGHMKTVCVLMLGWLLFDSDLTLKNIAGMALAVVGMVVYS